MNNNHHPMHSMYVFFCGNVRDADSGRRFCGGETTDDLYQYCRETMQAKKPLLNGERIVKVNKSGCLGQCHLGPNVVVFPDNVWYRCTSKEDVDTIIADHIMGGRVVESLLNTRSL